MMIFEKLSQERQNKIAFDLALAAVRTGSLPGLRNAISLSKGLDGLYSSEWAEIVQAERDWTLIEAEHGIGSMLNLSHPLIEKMSNQSRRFRLPAASVVNAERYARSESDPHGAGCAADAAAKKSSIDENCSQMSPRANSAEISSNSWD